MSYKEQLKCWARDTCSQWNEYLPKGFSANSFFADIDRFDNNQAYGMALGLAQFIRSYGNVKKEEKHDEQVCLKTYKYSDGSVRVYNPFSGKTYAM